MSDMVRNPEKQVFSHSGSCGALICDVLVPTLRSVCETRRKLLTENEVRNCRVFTVHHWYAILVVATSRVVKATTSLTSGWHLDIMAPAEIQKYTDFNNDVHKNIETINPILGLVD